MGKRINMIDSELYKELGVVCRDKGLKIGFVLDKLVSEFIKNNK